MSSLIWTPCGLSSAGRLNNEEVYLSVVSEADWSMVQTLSNLAVVLPGLAQQSLCIGPSLSMPKTATAVVTLYFKDLGP